MTDFLPDSDGDVEYQLHRDVDDLARQVGCEVIRPTSREVLVDLDGVEAIQRFEVLYDMYLRLVGPLEIAERYASRSGTGQHVVLRLPHPISDMERVQIQSLLGSDPKRELLSHARIVNGIPDVSVLFRPKA